ncbi:MAG: phosphoenolpyruvate carboxykinase (GTP) [Candidatus Omnitrophica bacterium]|nr:phosphoenolpyruvate carboxykinase (GTP) [Candidatus Omnitrophota bacterium]
MELLRSKCLPGGFEKLTILNNESVLAFVAKYAEHSSPDRIFVRTDAGTDHEAIRQQAIALGEEKALAMKGHTVHYDGPRDQARDKENTRYLTSKTIRLHPALNLIDREKGLDELDSFFKDAMKGKTMFVCFFCLGPIDSPFTLLAAQITDSAYVAHSEGILYRSGYGEFKKRGAGASFFRFVHTAGTLEDCVSKDVDKRRVYIDLDEDIVYSTNTQYAGNTVGLKKLALRLAIKKASREDWLAEHMFIMGVTDGDAKHYFTGAFPSACGKTSTAMIPGETIIGDDIAYLRNADGVVRAVNVEDGIFGIIQDVNPADDPIIYESLTTPGDVIFSNVLAAKNGVPHWLGDGKALPDEGVTFTGAWRKGEKDKEGKDKPYAHKNARYTVSLRSLRNVDENLDRPEGVEISGIIFGGRDSNTTVPVQQAFDWEHGVLTMGAALESETTAATLGKEGVRQFNLMSNLDFISIPFGEYIGNYLLFGERLDRQPSVFLVNYFLRDADGTYMNAIEDKRVWVKWMQRRVAGAAGAIKTPTGYIPLYEDIARLFNALLNKEYPLEAYKKQFTLRIPENIAKIDRIVAVYQKYENIPAALFDVLGAQKERLLEAAGRFGEHVSPTLLQDVQGVSRK